jgi:hypothetical protein
MLNLPIVVTIYKYPLTSRKIGSSILKPYEEKILGYESII